MLDSIFAKKAGEGYLVIGVEKTMAYVNELPEGAIVSEDIVDKIHKVQKVSDHKFATIQHKLNECLEEFRSNIPPGKPETDEGKIEQLGLYFAYSRLGEWFYSTYRDNKDYMKKTREIALSNLAYFCDIPLPPPPVSDTVLDIINMLKLLKHV